MKKGSSAQKKPRLDPLALPLIAGEPPTPPALVLPSTDEETPTATDATVTAQILFFLQGLAEQRPVSEDLDPTALTTLRSYLPSDAPQWQAISQRAALALVDLMKTRKRTEEVEQHFQAMAKARGKQRHDTLLLWHLSLIGAATLDTQEEEKLLSILPRLFFLNDDFFLARSWVREGLAIWYREGEEKKIHRAFFGKGAKGVLAFKSILLEMKRDAGIVDAVHRLQEAGYSDNQAAANAAPYFCLSPAAIKAICRKVNSGYQPLVSRFT